jgi:hypothetical protein
VYVYTNHGVLQGSWTAGGLPGNAQLTGIATNGTDIWLVDSSSDKVYKYTGAASRTSGNQNAASSFSLSVHGHSGNGNPQDLVTDGTSFWVVDGTAHMVFKYTLSGSLLGSWTIDPANAHPTGITTNPANVSDIWIVDNGTDKVYQYVGAATRTSGSQNAAATFALNPSDTNAQGIADPPPADMLRTETSAPLALKQSAIARDLSMASRDALFALLVGEFLPRLGAPSVEFPLDEALTHPLDWARSAAISSQPSPSDPGALLALKSLRETIGDHTATDWRDDTLADEKSPTLPLTDAFVVLVAEQSSTEGQG